MEYFSNVVPRKIKRSKPILEIQFKTHLYYIYLNEEKAFYYMTSTPAKARTTYNLNRENEQKRFYYDYLIDLHDACINERFKFEKYSMYDLIMNYKKFFNVSYWQKDILYIRISLQGINNNLRRLGTW